VGFVPNLFRPLTLQPKLLESFVALLDAILFKQNCLSRVQKESILFVLAAARSNAYCFAWHFQTLKLFGVPEQRLEQIAADYEQVELAPQNRALLKFVLKLGLAGNSISRQDIGDALLGGLTEESLLDAILTTALSRLLCMAALGLRPNLDFSARTLPVPLRRSWGTPRECGGPYLNSPRFEPQDLAPFAFLQEFLRLIPNVFRAQTLRMDALLAELALTEAILFADSGLTRKQKQSVGLAIATADRNIYWMALFSELLGEVGESANSTLTECAVKLAKATPEFAMEAIEALDSKGFTQDQIIEWAVVVSFACFLNTVQFGLGATPEFSPPNLSSPVLEKIVHLPAEEPRHSVDGTPVDPDTEIVARVQVGDVDAFEELIHRHSRRVYRTLVGILADPDEARDAMQDTFLKAYQHLSGFQRRSKFSTWLLSIASNTGIERLRRRKEVESLDGSGLETEEGFRPRQIQAWEDDPEQLYSRIEMRSLIENGVMRLPAKYRVVVMLRDIEQLSAEDAAAALGLGIPALKARLLRGRLMLREALAPHFMKGAKGAAH